MLKTQEFLVIIQWFHITDAHTHCFNQYPYKHTTRALKDHRKVNYAAPSKWACMEH